MSDYYEVLVPRLVMPAGARRPALRANKGAIFKASEFGLDPKRDIAPCVAAKQIRAATPEEEETSDTLPDEDPGAAPQGGQWADQTEAKRAYSDDQIMSLDGDALRTVAAQIQPGVDHTEATDESLQALLKRVTDKGLLPPSNPSA